MELLWYGVALILVVLAMWIAWPAIKEAIHHWTGHL